MSTVRPRRKGKRRTRHPLELPPRDGSPNTELSKGGEPVRFGPQAELCRNTMCCVCWALKLISGGHVEVMEHGAWIIDWTRLPTVPRGMSDPHHEPEGPKSDDDDTLPLCRAHHTGPAFAVRHILGPKRFWDTVSIRWEAVRDEMRRRLEQGT